MIQTLPVVDCKIAEPARSDGARHRRKTDEGNRRDRRYANEFRHRFVKIHAEDQTERTASHTARRFRLSGIDVFKGGFDLTRKKRHRSENERNDCTFHSDGRSDERSRKRNQKYEEHDERNRSE